MLTANGSVGGLTSSEASTNHSAADSESVTSPCVGVCDWTTGHVAEWLQRISLQHYVELFTSHEVNGRTLLQLDTAQMKVCAICVYDRLDTVVILILA